ncbi:DUF2975 domain-containing protein [Gracilimonas tropica]|uniref:DUF2975 domain-containing protein n=1 Tax=Gracilimonas tropica TaxID=454600 RepID=UPI000380AF99|nr:DUF2975 domain-containing protein [Gracilimonas tropica]
MKFRKDWSLAYFLLYLCQLSYWLIILGVVVEIISSIGYLTNGRVVIRDIPVNMELEQFDPYKDIEFANSYMNIPERMTSEIHISGDYEEVKSAFFFYNGLKIYENAVFFILLYLFSKVLRNVAEGSPFHSKNSTYLSQIGTILFAVGTVNFSFLFLNSGHFISLPILNNLGFPEGIDITYLDLFGKDFIFAGIFMIVLGYIFKEGTRIYEEQKLTV